MKIDDDEIDDFVPTNRENKWNLKNAKKKLEPASDSNGWMFVWKKVNKLQMKPHITTNNRNKNSMLKMHLAFGRWIAFCLSFKSNVFHSLDSWLDCACDGSFRFDVKIDCSFSISLSVPIATEAINKFQH